MGQQSSKSGDDGLSANESTEQVEANSVSNDNATSSANTSLPKPFKESVHWNAKFLLGNLENLPASAQRLFSMGKLYLSRDEDKEREAGYQSLFQMLPSSGDNENVVPTDFEHNETCSSEDESSGQNPFVHRVKKMTNLFVPMQNSAPLTCTQTYVQWRAAHDLSNIYSLCLHARNVIYVQPINDFPQFLTSFTLTTNSLRLSFLEMLQGFLQIFFSGMEVAIQPPTFVEDVGWNVRSRLHQTTNQKQYCVTDLYPCLQTVLPKDGRCIVGISWTDLYPEGFNFVLGEASNIHSAAVISFGRFETTNYDADSHRDVSKVDGDLVWKLLKTISHEVCHVFGFSHCSFFLCAMNESSSIQQALSQPLFLCPVCLRKLQRVCGFDILDRYRLLHKFLANVDQQLGDSQNVKEAVLWLDSCIRFLTMSIKE